MGVAYLLAIVGVRSVEELDAREGASELAATGDPRDGGSLIEQEAGVEELDPLLLDESHTQHLALLLIRDQLSRQHLPHQARYIACARYMQWRTSSVISPKCFMLYNYGRCSQIGCISRQTRNRQPTILVSCWSRGSSLHVRHSHCHSCCRWT